jgi:hypothetical protein
MGRPGMAGEHGGGELTGEEFLEARWLWMYEALARLNGELDRNALVTHVTVGAITAGGETLVYAVRLGVDDVQRVIVATDQATQAAVQDVLEQATTDATVPSHHGSLPP